MTDTRQSFQGEWLPFPHEKKHHRSWTWPPRFVAAATLLTLFTLSSCSRNAGKRRLEPAVIAVSVTDVSGSSDSSARCDEVAARLRPLLTDERLNRLDALVLATGGASGEPTVLVPWTTFAPSGQLFESPEADQQERDVWLGDLVKTCRQAMRPSDASPVYEAVDRALAAIASRCTDLATNGFECVRRTLSVHSDLRSTWGAFGRYLKALANYGVKATPQAPKRLSVDGIELYFCGLSNTDAGDGLPSEVVSRAWEAVLGRPLVADPTCPVDHASNAGGAQ